MRTNTERIGRHTLETMVLDLHAAKLANDVRCGFCALWPHPLTSIISLLLSNQCTFNAFVRNTGKD